MKVAFNSISHFKNWHPWQRYIKHIKHNYKYLIVSNFHHQFYMDFMDIALTSFLFFVYNIIQRINCFFSMSGSPGSKWKTYITPSKKKNKKKNNKHRSSTPCVTGEKLVLTVKNGKKWKIDVHGKSYGLWYAKSNLKPVIFKWFSKHI